MPNRTPRGTRFPIRMDVWWPCPQCRRTVQATLTAYPDAVYVTCIKGHHLTYQSGQQMPSDWREWYRMNLGVDDDPGNQDKPKDYRNEPDCKDK